MLFKYVGSLIIFHNPDTLAVTLTLPRSILFFTIGPSRDQNVWV